MGDEASNDIVTSRRSSKLRDRARRAGRNGKTAVVVTLRDHHDGPLSLLLVAEPGQPSAAYSYFVAPPNDEIPTDGR